MAKGPCRPLKITVKVRDGRIISSDGIIMFDSIIYHAWFAKYAPHVLRGEGDENWNGMIGLPFRSLGGNRWAASKGIYKEVSKTVEHYNRRPDFFAADKIGHLAENSGKISDSMGKYRAYRNPVIVSTLENGEMTFYCVGHAEKIKELIACIPAVGKKPSMGWGIIEDVKIEHIEQDYSLWHPEYGLMRPLPVDDEAAEGLDLAGYPVMYYGIKPPYWKAKNQVPCFVPVPEMNGVIQ